MQKIKKLLKFWLPPVLWAGLIFTFSSFPTVKTSEFFLGDFILKKTAHIIEYGVLATLLYRAMINSGVEKKKSMWLAVIIAVLYGITDEVHQSFTPGRGPAVRDVLIDTSGALIFIYGIVGNIKKTPVALQKIYNKFSFI
ncbi:MAG: phosphotransbutyrylase [uncultured bacterium]|nr:MAG: phosphotransbutyrylase [uncultured bacterium]